MNEKMSWVGDVRSHNQLAGRHTVICWLTQPPRGCSGLKISFRIVLFSHQKLNLPVKLGTPVLIANLWETHCWASEYHHCWRFNKRWRIWIFFRSLLPIIALNWVSLVCYVRITMVQCEQRPDHPPIVSHPAHAGLSIIRGCRRTLYISQSVSQSVSHK